MSEYIYPAVFHKNNNGSYTVLYPDLEGCITEGKTLGNAIYMAQSALTQWIEYLIEKEQVIPAPTDLKDIKVYNNEFVNLVCANIRDGRAVRRTVSIPKWLDDEAIKSGISLSRVLQDALKDKLNI